uniref:Ariadne RBR E3 ubiquitin protein ligase 2 n=1 Tax=Ovis aries TaxID=9940 RepID=A0AC11EQX5_SHEEP
MSVDMNSQGSDSNEEDYDPNCEEEEEDEDPGDIEDYYVGVASDVEQQGADSFDPEEYQFTCLTYKESEGALNEHMTSLASVLKAVDALCHRLLPPYGTVSAEACVVFHTWRG